MTIISILIHHIIITKDFQMMQPTQFIHQLVEQWTETTGEEKMLMNSFGTPTTSLKTMDPK